MSDFFARSLTYTQDFLNGPVYRFFSDPVYVNMVIGLVHLLIFVALWRIGTQVKHLRHAVEAFGTVIGGYFYATLKAAQWLLKFGKELHETLKIDPNWPPKPVDKKE